MLQLNEYLLVAALVFVVLSLITYLVVLSASRRAAPTRRPAMVGAGARGAGVHRGMGDGDAGDGDAGPVGTVPTGPMGAADGDAASTYSVGLAEMAELDDEPVRTARPVRTVPKKIAAPLNVSTLATGFSVVALVLLTAYLGVRIGLTGHGPFSNQHEFAVSFVWGIMLAFVVALWRFKIRMLALGVLPVAACLLGYATQTDAGVEPLVPALQNNLLLTLHVGFAILSYGAACVSFGAAIIYLVHPKTRVKTPRDRFDEIGYKGAIVAFPLMTVMILLGSLWANVAWGRYWGWDPKETAALVTWLLYGAFLHARVVRGWRGKKAAWLLIIGFAAVLFAYFGNYFFGGLHSYG